MNFVKKWFMMVDYHLPTEVWTMILSYTKYPAKLNYRNVNGKFRSIVDRCNLGLVVDLNQYRRLIKPNWLAYYNPNRLTLERQIDYLMDDCGKVIKGLVIKDGTPFTSSTSVVLLSILVKVINRQADQLEQIVGSNWADKNETINIIADVIGRCSNLNRLEGVRFIDLINLPLLQMLKGQQFRNLACCVNVTHFEIRGRIGSRTDLLKMMAVVSPNLEYLRLSGLSYGNGDCNGHTRRTTPIFLMPKLKRLCWEHVRGTAQMGILIDVTQSVGLYDLKVLWDSRLFEMREDSCSQVIGLVLNKPSLKQLSVGYDKNDVIMTPLFNAPELMNQLEEFNFHGRFPLAVAVYVEMLSVNCFALRRLWVEKFEFGDASILDPKFISICKLLDNSPNLQYLALPACNLAKDQLIELIILKQNVDIEVKFEFGLVLNRGFVTFSRCLLNKVSQYSMKKRENQFLVILDRFVRDKNKVTKGNYSDLLVNDYNINVKIK